MVKRVSDSLTARRTGHSWRGLDTQTSVPHWIGCTSMNWTGYFDQFRSTESKMQFVGTDEELLWNGSLLSSFTTSYEHTKQVAHPQKKFYETLADHSRLSEVQLSALSVHDSYLKQKKQWRYWMFASYIILVHASAAHVVPHTRLPRWRPSSFLPRASRFLRHTNDHSQQSFKYVYPLHHSNEWQLKSSTDLRGAEVKEEEGTTEPGVSTASWRVGGKYVRGPSNTKVFRHSSVCLDILVYSKRITGLIKGWLITPTENEYSIFFHPIRKDEIS